MHMLTCANKHDIILSVLCFDPIHHDLFKHVRNVGLDEHWLAQGWVHWPPHQWMTAGKVQHRIGEILCAAKLSSRLIGDFTGALKMQRGKKEVKK